MKKTEILNVYVDGGSRGNPGPGAIAAIIKDNDNTIRLKTGRKIGFATNNIAEYKAVVNGIAAAAFYSPKLVNIFSDSLLVISHLRGKYEVKSPGLKIFYNQINKMLKESISTIYFHHIPREENEEADALVNEILDGVYGDDDIRLERTV